MTIHTDIEEDGKQKSIKEPKNNDYKKISDYLKEHFGELCSYDKKEKIVYLCDNNILGTPEFIELLKKYKFYVQPSLF